MQHGPEARLQRRRPHGRRAAQGLPPAAGRAVDDVRALRRNQRFPVAKQGRAVTRCQNHDPRETPRGQLPNTQIYHAIPFQGK